LPESVIHFLKEPKEFSGATSNIKVRPSKTGQTL